MVFWLALIFGSVALAAAGFVVYPALAQRGAGLGLARIRTAGIAGVLVLLFGLGLYIGLGRPDYALMSLRDGPREDNFQEAIAYLSQIIRERPNDIQGWTILGRGYLSFGRPEEASQAFQRAIDIAYAQQGSASPELMVDYALARGMMAGALNEEVQTILREVLTRDPENPDARYYLGLALAEEGQSEAALSLWDGLLADAPANASWREALPNQIVALHAETSGAGGAPPDIGAMVDGLAARLSEQPDDLEGWTMLIRAYAVLGETENAHAALDRARQIFAGNQAAQEALAEQARASALE